MSKNKQQKTRGSTQPIRMAIAVPVLLVIAIRMIAGFFPQSSVWGMNYHGFLDTVAMLTLGLTAMIVAVPAVAKRLHPALDRVATSLFPVQDTRSLLMHGLIAVVFGVCCWLFVVPFAFLGDGVHVARSLFRYNTGAGLAYGTLWLEPLSVFVYNGLITTFDSSTAEGSGVNLVAYTNAFVYTSIILGVAYMFAVLRMSAGVTTHPLRRLALVTGIVGCAGIVFYFGYVEFYAFLYLFGTLFLLSAMREVGRPAFPAWSVALLLGAILFHLSALAFLPVLGVLLWSWNAQRKGKQPITGKAWTGAIVGLLLAAFAVYVVLNLTGRNSFFIAMTSDKGYLALFSPQHLLDGLNNLFLHSPIGAALLLLMLGTRKQIPFGDPRFLIAATSTVIWLALCFSHSAIARDWDVYALLGVSMILTGYFFLENLSHDASRRYLITQLTLQPLLLVIPWIALNASFDASLRRYSSITETYAPLLPPEVTLGHLETLRSAFVTAGMTEAEILTVVRSLQLTFDPYECYKLTRAFENAKEMSPMMLRAAESIMNLIITQPDSIRARPVGQDAASQATTLNDMYFYLTRAVVRLLPEEQKPSLTLSALKPLYEKGIRTFDLAAYIENRYFDAKDYDEALRWFVKALPDSNRTDEEGRRSIPYILHGMAIAYAKHNDEPRSLEYFRKAISYAEVPAITWSDYGFALYRFGRYQEAVVPFSKALEKDSNIVNALYCLGRIYLRDAATHTTGKRLLMRYLPLETDAARVRDTRELLERRLEDVRSMSM